MSEKIVIIGAGPAGIEAAATAANYSNDVTIITNRRVGEWKLAHTSIWLHVVGSQSDFDSEEKISAINEMSDEIQNDWSNEKHRFLQSLGVHIVYGVAEFVSSSHVKVTNPATGEQSTVEADKIIIASGSRPMFPTDMKPDGQHIFSYHTLNQLKTLPKSILVVGDGAIGFEAVNLFSRLRLEVTWIVPGEKPMSPIGDPDIDAFLIHEYERRGVHIVSGQFVSTLQKEVDGVRAIREDGSMYQAEKAFVTLGFRSNIDSMNIEAAGLYVDGNGLMDCNDHGQTAVPSIYIVGDAQLTIAAVYAMAKARVAALHAMGQPVEPVELSKTPLSFNEYPQVAAVGRLETRNSKITTRMIQLKEHNFHGLVVKENAGFIKLYLDHEGIIIGGSVVGYQGKELINTIALLIEMKSTMEQASTFYGAHPSTSEALFHGIRHSIREEQLVL